MAAPKRNQFAIGNSGQSKRWATSKELQKDIDKYFEKCDSRVIKVYDKKKEEVIEISNPIPYTIEGLCDVLDCERMTLLNYEKKAGYEEFFYTIKKAKLKIQRNKVERGLEGTSPTGFAIFDLVNNSDYENIQKVENTNRNIEIPPIKFVDTDGD